LVKHINDYLINCEDFNNLNGNENMTGTGIMQGYVHPHTQLKKLGILHTHRPTR